MRTFEEWWESDIALAGEGKSRYDKAQAAWEAAYKQAIQDIIDYSEHMGDVEKFARQHGIRVEE